MAGDAGIDGHLKYIPPTELHQYWELIKPGLIEIQKSSDGWIPEDVYAALRNNQATLHLDFAEEYGGFVVLQEQVNYDGKALHIWCAFSRSIKPITVYIPEIELLARKIGARRITLSSRRNWSHYFEEVVTIYKKEII